MNVMVFSRARGGYMLSFVIFTIRMFFMCKYWNTTGNAQPPERWVLSCINPLHGKRLCCYILESLCYLHHFPMKPTENARVCSPSFFFLIHLLSDPHSIVLLSDPLRDLLFISEALFISFLSHLKYPDLSIFVFHWIFKCRNANIKPRAQWNKGHNVTQLLFNVLMCTHSFSSIWWRWKNVDILSFLYISTVCHWVDSFPFSFSSSHEELHFFFQSHYACNWISVEPFRAVWLSY